MSAVEDDLYRRVARRLYDEMNRRERYLDGSFFGGPAASAPARARLRAVLAASADVQLVADLRYYFNSRHAEGDLITEADVSCAIRLLTPNA